MEHTPSGEATRPSARSIAALADELIDVTDGEIDERIRSLELERRAIEAELALTIAAAERRRIHLADGHRSLKGYLRATANWSNPEVATQRSVAHAVEGLPGLAEALHAGRIGTPQASAIARTFHNPRVRDRLVEFAPILLDLAERCSFDDFVVALRRFEMLADLDGAHHHLDERIAARNVHLTTVGGMLHLDAVGGDPLVNEELEAIFRRFCEHEFRKDAAARRVEHGDAADGNPLARTHQQRSYDAFVDLMRRADTSLDTVADAPKRAAATVGIVVDHRTWGWTLVDAGLAPTVDLTGEPIDPFTGFADGGGDLLAHLVADPDAFANMRCETAGGTLLHPHQVLRAALAGHVRRVVVDAHSVPIDFGRKRRLFTGPSREAAKLLVRHCDHTGCDLPEQFCDVDHVVEWVDRGATDQCNAGCRCGHHNRLKHRRRFTTRRAIGGQPYTVRPDGSVILPVGARPPTFPDDANDDDDPVREAIEDAERTRLAVARIRQLLPVV